VAFRRDMIMVIICAIGMLWGKALGSFLTYQMLNWKFSHLFFGTHIMTSVTSGIYSAELSFEYSAITAEIISSLFFCCFRFDDNGDKSNDESQTVARKLKRIKFRKYFYKSILIITNLYYFDQISSGRTFYLDASYFKFS